MNTATSEALWLLAYVCGAGCLWLFLFVAILFAIFKLAPEREQNQIRQWIASKRKRVARGSKKGWIFAPSKSCPQLAATPGPSSRADTLAFCAALMRAHTLGLNKSALVVDVGTDMATEARTARNFGHPVLSFECRGAMASSVLFDKWLRDDSGVKLVHACLAERSGVGSLVRALDSSSMVAANVQGDKALNWKRVKEKQPSESVPMLPLDDAIDDASLRALGWATDTRVGFVKIDVQGFEGQVLQGALKTLRRHRPFLYYEDSLLPMQERKGVLIKRLMHGEQWSYDCSCSNDCFCRARACRGYGCFQGGG